MKRQLLLLSLLASAALPVWAAECKATVEANDAMQYNIKSIVVPKACAQFTVTLKHVGKMAKTVMGHNLVLGRTADQNAINADGMKAGAAANYVRPNDPRVLAHTRLIGGGESATVVIPVKKLKAGESYTYFCSFPGHAAIMKGTLKLGG